MANLKCSESRRWAAYPSMCRTRIAHDHGVDGGTAQTRRDYVRPSRSIFSNALNFQYRQVGRLRAFKNSADVDAALPINKARFGQALAECGDVVGERVRCEQTNPFPSPNQASAVLYCAT